MTQPLGVWTWKPQPLGPDPVPESDAVFETGPGCIVIGARIRGKRHRHLGTFGDDWFAIQTTDRWTIVAVSDGAGSMAFSRVGARVSCETAIATLAATLSEGMTDDDLRQALADAASAARTAGIDAANERKRSVDHYVINDRQVEAADFSATLLLVAYQPGVVAAFQIGDGAILASADGTVVRQLGKASTGDYAGETEFLVTFRGTLIDHTHIDREPTGLILLATDGVADDYFPAETGGPQLIADLILNGVLPHGSTEPARPAETVVAQPIAGPGGVREIPVASIEAYAASLDRPVEAVLHNRKLLAAGRIDGPNLPQVRLVDWLEGYTVRGSFDDRTLVALVTR